MSRERAGCSESGSVREHGSEKRRQSEAGYFVYLVECADGTLYTGISTDVARRVAEHNAGAGAKYTRARRPVRVVYVEEAADRSAASRREFEIKRLSRKEKEALIASAPSPAL